MFFENAERTRLLLQAFGQQAFQRMNFDAMRGIGALVEVFLWALEHEDEALLRFIDAALVDWAVVLDRLETP
ncbi:hypothetical protein [Deinococcus ruber]|uniref:Uncharacterized protein n=1 Tax=Deinococcus ruber TaxID=1848197 RepID=A0A918CH12_9DEIO|nr:hypothetical protein [Deinococcus ruber]GGR23226.1 hypothetical protein GCM10008957_38960 [Deinococcus ruber]